MGSCLYFSCTGLTVLIRVCGSAISRSNKLITRSGFSRGDPTETQEMDISFIFNVNSGRENEIWNQHLERQRAGEENDNHPNSTNRERELTCFIDGGMKWSRLSCRFDDLADPSSFIVRVKESLACTEERELYDDHSNRMTKLSEEATVFGQTVTLRFEVN